MSVGTMMAGHEHLARILAHVVAANGCVDDGEIEVLKLAGAFESMSVTRERFIALAHEALASFGHRVADSGGLSLTARSHLLKLLVRVECHEQRRLLRQLAAQVIRADGAVTLDEMDVCEAFDHAWAKRSRSNVLGSAVSVIGE